jgi:hypothetical protein
MDASFLSQEMPIRAGFYAGAFASTGCCCSRFEEAAKRRPPKRT